MDAPSGCRPFEPWLFLQEGWDWRWLSFADAARWAGAVTAALAGLPPGARVGFSDRLTFWSLAMDLGVRAAGGTAVPVAVRRPVGEAVRHRRCSLWLSAPDEGAEAGSPGVPRVVVPSPRAAGPAAAAVLPGSALLGEAPGAAVLVVDGEAVGEVEAAELTAQAAELDRRLETGTGRPITLLHQPLERPLARLLFAWAARRGAAIVLEPQAVALAATAAWARPTLLAVEAGDLPHLRRAVDLRKSRWRRRPGPPFGRLRHLVVDARQVPAEEEAAFWRERGVAIVPVRPPGGVV